MGDTKRTDKEGRIPRFTYPLQCVHLISPQLPWVKWTLFTSPSFPKHGLSGLCALGRWLFPCWGVVLYGEFTFLNSPLPLSTGHIV